MDTVIVPLDGSVMSERALGPARALACRAGTSLRLLMCCPPGPDVESARGYLETRVLALGDGDIEVPSIDVEIVYDREPVEAILMAAEQVPDSLVCMSTHGRSGVGVTVLGSVAEGVVRDARGPLILVGPDAERNPHLPDHPRILVCVDQSTLSRAVIVPAVDLAKAIGGEVAVVHVVEPILEFVPSPIMVGPVEPEVPELEAIAREVTARGVNGEVGVAGSTRRCAARSPSTLVAHARRTSSRSRPTAAAGSPVSCSAAPRRASFATPHVPSSCTTPRRRANSPSSRRSGHDQGPRGS